MAPASHRYLSVLTLTGLITVSCSTNMLREAPPPTKIDNQPLSCPLKDGSGTESALSVSTTSEVRFTQRVIESFTFPYDSVVESFLHSPGVLTYPQLATLPRTRFVAQLDTLGQYTLFNYREEAPRAQIETFLKEAQRFVGVPYRYGGTSPRGFDCSGLVYYTLKHTGISVPRTAHAQYLHAIPVKKAELRPGDLVFFRTNRRTRRITHVGIYLGDNQFIHARSGGKKVDITSLSNSYYKKRFVRGGRVL